MVLSYGTGNAEMVVRSHDVGGGVAVSWEIRSWRHRQEGR